MLSRNVSYKILMKKVAAFCPCPKSLPEAKEIWINFFGRENHKTA